MEKVRKVNAFKANPPSQNHPYPFVYFYGGESGVTEIIKTDFKYKKNSITDQIHLPKHIHTYT